MSNRSSPSVLQVYIFRDGQFLGTDIFSERHVIIGRDPDESDLVLESSQVSRKHATIEHDGEHVVVRDAGSTNGILVNGQKVEMAQVTRLDEISIGEFTLKLKFSGGKQRAPQPIESASTRVMQLDQPIVGVETDKRQALSLAVEAAKRGPAAAEASPSESTSAPREPAKGLIARGLGKMRGEREAPPRAEPRREPIGPDTDLREFDDLPSRDDINPRKPRAAARERGEPIGHRELDEMLQGIGIAPAAPEDETAAASSEPIVATRVDGESVSPPGAEAFADKPKKKGLFGREPARDKASAKVERDEPRSDKADKVAKPEKVEKIVKADKPERAEKPDRPAKPDKTEKPARDVPRADASAAVKPSASVEEHTDLWPPENVDSGELPTAMLPVVGDSSSKSAERKPAERKPAERKPSDRKAPERADAQRDELASVVARASSFDDDLSGADASPAAPAYEPHGEDDDDHDDDDEPNFVPPFSMRELVVGEPAGADGKDPGSLVVEVIGVRADGVREHSLLWPGDSFWVGPKVGMFARKAAPELPPRYELVAFGKRGAVEIEVRKDAEGRVVRGGQVVRLGAMPSKSSRQAERRGTMMLGLSPGELLEVKDGPSTYHVRFVRPPKELVDRRPLSERIKPEKSVTRAAGGSLVGHLAAAIFFSVFSVTEEPKGPPREEFVEVSLEQEMKLEEPPPEPPKEEPPPPEPTPEPPPAPKEMQAAPKKIKKQVMGGTSPAPPGVLGLLNKTGSTAAPGPAAAVAALSNLSAAKVPGGSSAGFKVSGLIGKTPTSDLSIGGGGGGGPLTKGAAELLRGGGGGAGALSGKGTRAVGGLVQKVPQAMRSVGQGQLDRDEIQKVINKGIGQIQRCYERELLKSPGLAGKVQVEWTIATSGAVKSARQQFTDMNSSAVVSCILAAIKGWQFPQPRGGEVVVSYPFIFKSIGF